MSPFRRGADQPHHLERDAPPTDQILFKALQLLSRGKATIPEHIGHFFKTDMFGQVMNVVAGINQSSHIAHHFAHFGLGDDHTF